MIKKDIITLSRYNPEYFKEVNSQLQYPRKFKWQGSYLFKYNSGFLLKYVVCIQAEMNTFILTDLGSRHHILMTKILNKYSDNKMKRILIVRLNINVCE